MRSSRSLGLVMLLVVACRGWLLGGDGAGPPQTLAPQASPPANTEDLEQEDSRRESVSGAVTGHAAGLDEPTEIIELRNGKILRGRVAGFDVSAKSYILSVDGNRMLVAEAEILTIRNSFGATGGSVGSGAPPVVAEPSVESRAAVQGQGSDRNPGKGAPLLNDGSGEDGEVTLASLLAQYPSLPSAKRPETIQALEEAVEKLRSGDSHAAVEPLECALRQEPEGLTAALLLAAIRLEVEKDPESAFGLLCAWANVASGPPATKALLARAAAALGYGKLRDRLQKEVIGVRYSGADREYRLFQVFRERDPEQALKAWQEYRKLDPRWELKGVRECRAIGEARSALEKNDPTAATAALSRVAADNPLFAEEARPLLVKAYLLRAERARAAGRFDVALADLDAACVADPERKEELAVRRAEVETSCVRELLAAATNAGEVEAVLGRLVRTVPDLKERYGVEIGKALCGIAKGALSREGVDAAIRALRVCVGWGVPIQEEVLSLLATEVSTEISQGDLAKARGHWKGIFGIAGLPEAADSVLGVLRAKIAAAHRKALDEALQRGDKGAARDLLTGILELDIEDAEARRELAKMDETPVGGSAPGGAGGSGGAPCAHLALEVGSRWQYLYGDGSREVQKLDRIETLPDGSKAWKFTAEVRLGEGQVPFQKTGFVSGGFFVLGVGTKPKGGDLILKVPPVNGDRWSWRKGDIDCDREYEAVDAKVVTKAGTFENCLKVKATSRFDSNGVKSRPVVQRFYFAPGVGLVKIEGDMPLDGRELEEYRIGNGLVKPGPGIVSGGRKEGTGGSMETEKDAAAAPAGGPADGTGGIQEPRPVRMDPARSKEETGPAVLRGASAGAENLFQPIAKDPQPRGKESFDHDFGSRTIDADGFGDDRVPAGPPRAAQSSESPEGGLGGAPPGH